MIGIFQLAGIFIPFAGMIALITRKQQSESSMKLLMATVSCMFMNSGYLLFLISENSDAAMTALKIEYLGGALFYFFFVQFLLAYQKIKLPKIVVYLWGVFECAVVGIYWWDSLRETLFGKFVFEQNQRFHYMTVQIEQSVFYMIRYCALSVILLAGLIYGIVAMFRAKVTAEKENQARLIGAQFIILLSLMIQILVNPNVDIFLEKEFLENVIKVAPMHDLGKVAVDDAVLRKPGKFTEEEYAKMKKHSAEGARVIRKVLEEVDDEAMTQAAVNVAHYHHERWDGKGYPNGLRGEEIPIEARIMALADVFDALVSKRCYKEAFDFDRAFFIIEDGLGTQFDPVLGNVFLSCRKELELLYTKIWSNSI